MKKNFIYLLLLCSLIAQAQVTPSYPTIKLTKTVEGVKQDSLLVVGTDKTVKHISSSKITSILEYTTASALPITGVAGKIYVTKDNGKIYRWNGTYYAELAITDISGKVDKIVGKGLSTEDYTTPEKTKLAELFNYDPTTINNAIALKVDKVTGKSLLSDTEITRLATLSNYTHPTNHPPSIITQDASNRFVTDVEKTAWNAKQGALGFTPENVANKNTANGYAGLGSDGKLISSQLPSITISDTFVTASQAAMLALTAETGDVAVRTDLNKSYILKENNPTVLASWQELLTPTSEVTSVNGRTGAVVVTKADVSLNNADNTSDANKPISTATQTALNGKENSFTKNTAFNKNFGTTAGTVAQGNDSRILNGQTAFGWGNHAGLYPSLTGTGATGTWGINISGTAASSIAWNGLQFVGDEQPVGAYSIGFGADGKFHYATAQAYKNWLGLGSNAYTSTAYLPIASPNSLNTWSFTNGFYGLHGSSVGMPSTSSYWSGIRTVLPNDSNYGLEITANIDQNELYFRRYAINYKSWQKLWHDGNFNPANYLPLSGGTLSGPLRFTGGEGVITPNTLISEINNYAGGVNQFKSSSIKFYTGTYVDQGKITFNTSIGGIDYVRLTLEETGAATFSSTVTASPATLPNHVVVKSQLDAVVARPYKVYTAVLKQQNTDAPSAVVLENTLGGTVVWTRNSTGNYYGTLNSAFPIQNKIALFQGGTMWGTLPLKIIRVQHLNSNTIQIFTQQATDGALVDSSLSETSIEIRVYL